MKTKQNRQNLVNDNINPQMAHTHEDDLFKKYKLKHHRLVSDKLKIAKRMTNHSIIEWNVILNIDLFRCFDKLSTLEILFDNLKLLLNSEILQTKDSIQKISCLLIDMFINWYHTLPFYSVLNLNINQLILNDQWSNYILLVIFYFLKTSYKQTDLISYEKSYERIFTYTQNYYLSTITHRLLNQFGDFLSQFFDIDITNTEFTLLSILLILQSGKFDSNQLKNLREIYLKMLFTYDAETFPLEQPFRYNRLLHFSGEIHILAQLLIKHQHFYLPFLLIPN